jgi:uncharacterized protein (TIGR02466 family)
MFVQLGPELAIAFGTPLSIRRVPNAAAINPGLERAILRRRAEDVGNRFSNVGGWQSRPDLLNWPEPEIAMLAAEIDRAIQQIMGMPAAIERRPAPQARVSYKTFAWANVNEPGNYNSMHMHPGHHWSLVYYVAAGAPERAGPVNGRLELRDPAPAAQYARVPAFPCGHPILIGPEAGMMILFPSYIEHSVHPSDNEGRRISIAVNVTLDEQPSPAPYL